MSNIEKEDYYIYNDITTVVVIVNTTIVYTNVIYRCFSVCKGGCGYCDQQTTYV
jgi:hypothetical protein